MASVCNFHKHCLSGLFNRVKRSQRFNSAKPLHCFRFEHQLKPPQELGDIFTKLINVKKSTTNVFPSRLLSTSSAQKFFKNEDNRPPESRVTIRNELFDKPTKKDKKAFLTAMQLFKEENTIRRGHIEFIYTAMRHMEDFEVEDDLETYKCIMDVFPKGKMIAETTLQVEFYHFPRHQTCGIELLDKMEGFGVIPDLEMRDIIVNTFGNRSHIYRKFARMMYWMPKFKNLTPFPLPRPVPNDALELARLAIKRICVDLQTNVGEYDAEDLEDAIDKTWIVSGMSPKQKQLIEEHDVSKTIYVEGPYIIWLRKKSISYFRLRAEPKVYKVVEEDLDDVRNLESPILDPIKTRSVIPKPSVHEQDDGVFLALCATGTSSRDSLLSWVRFLQKENPKLNTIPILFTLLAPSKELVTVNLNFNPQFLSGGEAIIENNTESQNPDSVASETKVKD